MTDAALPAAAHADDRSPWPGRLAAWTLWAAVPLILFGGTVTTLRAGMAEDGWLHPENQFLWLMPWARRISSAGLFVEHHHRELGTLVGLLAIGTVVVTCVHERRLGPILAAVLALAAVIVQGAIGGFRVLENNPQLAFLHGALGQAVFALLAAVALYLSRGWSRAPRVRWTARTGLALAPFAALLVYGQIVLGAWLRHGHSSVALSLHVLGALAALGALLALAHGLKSAAQRPEARGEPARLLRRQGRRVLTLLAAQVALGVLATIAIYSWSGGMQSQTIHPGEVVFATAHVAVGALLLAVCVNAALWSRRLDASGAPA
jgi:cytochrome c oxidase assembly protein subunit 15